MDIRTASRSFQGFDASLHITLVDGTKVQSRTAFEIREEILATTDSAALAVLEAELALAEEAEAIIAAAR
ncbi:MAG: hypothetical protein H6827_09765 [Planctomycetes bacterium]|nr:hypothetical protein [Planctomycetota bacterium]